MIHVQSTLDRWPLEDASVQSIITSPPYWGLRKYAIPDIILGGDPACSHLWDISRPDTALCQQCGAFRGQHGLEPSPEMYIQHAMLWISEAWRVLRPDGILWINIGDTYGGSWGNMSSKKPNTGALHGRYHTEAYPVGSVAQGARRKSLALIPERLMLALYDAGWIIRDRLVWVKPNGIPESTKDRMTRRYETVLMLTKSQRYFFNLDAVRRPYKEDSIRRFSSGYNKPNIPQEAMPGRKQPHQRVYRINPLGANPGNVLTFSAARGGKYGHYAMFPEALVEMLVKCSTHPGDVVLDPFCGSGTTIVVAERLGRQAIGIDLGYQDVQAKRMTSQKPLLQEARP